MLYTVNGSEVIRLGAGVLPGEIHGMKVVIAKGPQVTVANSPSGATYTEIWGKHARLLYVDPSAPWGSPTSLYRFRHTAPIVKRWRTDDPDVEYIRELERCVELLVAPDTTYILKGVIS
jgi:hypothetical protein